MTRKQGRRRRQLLDDLKRRREYWILKEEALEEADEVGFGLGTVVSCSRER